MKKLNIVGGAAFAALLFTGGAGFADSKDQAASAVVGYDSTTISATTVGSMSYGLSPTGLNIAMVRLVLLGDTRGSAVKVALNESNWVTCGVGTFDDTNTTYSCNVTSLAQSTEGLTVTHVIVN